MNKRKWSKPELTVLVRSNPEEAVLILCKAVDMVGPAINGVGNFCLIATDTGCQALGVS